MIATLTAFSFTVGKHFPKSRIDLATSFEAMLGFDKIFYMSLMAFLLLSGTVNKITVSVMSLSSDLYISLQ